MSGPPDQTAPTVPQPWHAGKLQMQQSLGVAAKMAVTGPRMIRDFMPDQHRDFYARLPFAVLGTVDPAGDVWATLATGQPGFIHSPAPRQLDLAYAMPAEDPAANGIAPGLPVGLLGIELHTRRRNRMNGQIARQDARGFRIAVEHSYGNCPQYIQLRDYAFIADHRPGPARSIGPLRSMIVRAA